MNEGEYAKKEAVFEMERVVNAFTCPPSPPSAPTTIRPAAASARSGMARIERMASAVIARRGKGRLGADVRVRRKTFLLPIFVIISML